MIITSESPFSRHIKVFYKDREVPLCVSLDTDKQKAMCFNNINDCFDSTQEPIILELNGSLSFKLEECLDDYQNVKEILQLTSDPLFSGYY